MARICSNCQGRPRFAGGYRRRAGRLCAPELTGPFTNEKARARERRPRPAQRRVLSWTEQVDGKRQLGAAAYGWLCGVEEMASFGISSTKSGARIDGIVMDWRR